MDRGQVKRASHRAAIVVAAVIANVIPGLANDLDLTCAGAHYRHRQPFPVEESVSLRTAGDGFSINLPDVKDPVTAKRVTETADTLILRANDLTFQYFKFTGQLFIKHADGHFSRLACKPTN